MLPAAWREGWRQRYFRWLDKRVPAARGHRLSRDKLYIFPTTAGFVFGAVVVVLWMLGTNYQNNLILALSLLLASLFILAILRTHSNLAGLEIRFHDADSGFAGQEIALHLHVINNSRRHAEAVNVHWQAQVPVVFDVNAGERRRVSACVFAARRGLHRPGRLRVESVFPLGLLRCWSWLNIEAEAVVFPQPEKFCELQAHAVEDDQADSPWVTTGSDEFSGLREYRPGDPLKQVAWKQFARDKGLLSKEFSSHVSAETWLAWEATAGLELEERLSTLCYWALHYERVNCRYGLSLPGVRIEPSQGAVHQQAVLTALALFQAEDGRG